MVDPDDRALTMSKLRCCRRGSSPHLVISFLLFWFRPVSLPQLFYGSSPHRLKDKEVRAAPKAACKGVEGGGWRVVLVDVGGLYFEGALQGSDSLRAPVQVSADVSSRAALTPHSRV